MADEFLTIADLTELRNPNSKKAAELTRKNDARRLAWKRRKSTSRRRPG